MFKPTASRRDLRKHYGIPEDDLVFAFVGRITSTKQPFRLMKFFSEVNRILNNSTLIIVGKGELLDDLKRFAVTNSYKKVRFLGYIPHRELPALYACSDFYLLSSVYEGQPLTLLEAMACGVPPLVSDIPSLRNIVNRSKAGLLLDFGDEEEAVKKTLRFVKEEDFQKQSKRARRYIVENHSWEKIAAQYMQLFDKIT
jgi:glycosyltransferase involved in cell wall biosynthesis